jgi:hypothetical protein
MALEIWRVVISSDMSLLVHCARAARSQSSHICWRLNTPRCSSKYHSEIREEADYAKLVVVLTCKSHDLANLATGHLV